jgi:hypothetical protein
MPLSLAVQRRQQERTMRDTCQIKRRQDGPRNQFGQREETWPVVAMVQCRISMGASSVGANEQAVMGALSSVPTFTLTVPWDTTVLDSDRIEHIESGNEYEVKDAGQPNTLATARKVMLQQIGRA